LILVTKRYLWRLTVVATVVVVVPVRVGPKTVTVVNETGVTVRVVAG